MLRKGLVIAFVVGLVMAGIAIARDGGRPSRSEPFTSLPGHSVVRPSKTVGAASTRTPPLRKVIYRESSGFTVNADSERGVSLLCPRRSAAINGYFGDSARGVVLDYSAIAERSVRKWQFVLLNMDPSNNIQAFIGVVCIK